MKKSVFKLLRHLYRHEAKLRQMQKQSMKHTNVFIHAQEGEFLCQKKSLDVHKNTQTRLDTCDDLLSLLFSCLAFHVQSLICDLCLSTEDRGREHNLCGRVEVKKMKKRR